MPFPTGVLLRWTVQGALGLCGFVALLGYWVGPDFEMRCASDHQFVSVRSPATIDHRPLFIDGRSGDLLRLSLPKEDELNFASVAPWTDEFGRSQVVGRWSSLKGTGTECLRQAFGLGRFSFPDGSPIDRIETSILPSSPPVWTGGSLPQILFCATNGKLFRCSLVEDETRRSALQQPVEVAWRVENNSSPPLVFEELARDSDNALAQVVIAAVRVQATSHADGACPESRIWWLRFNADFTCVEAAGPLTTHAPHLTATTPGINSGRSCEEERFPTLGRTRDNRPCLAYLTRKPSDQNWTLRAALIEWNARENSPYPLGQDSVTIMNDCAGSAASFSGDGLLLHALQAPRSHRTSALPLAKCATLPTLAAAGAPHAILDKPAPE